METRVTEALLMRDCAVDGGSGLTGDEISAYLAVLGRLAALDGFHAAEKRFIHRLAASLGLDPDVARNAHKLVADPAIPTEKLVERIKDPGVRLCLLRDAYRLAEADESFSDAELRELSVIATSLKIAQATAAAVRSVALQEARIRREFARLAREARA